jgi:hypothetical protein
LAASQFVEHPHVGFPVAANAVLDTKRRQPGRKDVFPVPGEQSNASCKHSHWLHCF